MTICLERGNIFKQSASRSFTSEISGLRKQYGMRGWRNWQTRTFEVRVVYPWGFESPPSHQKPVHIVCWFFFLCEGGDLEQGGGIYAASKATVRLCLACGSQPVGMSIRGVPILYRSLFVRGRGLEQGGGIYAASNQPSRLLLSLRVPINRNVYQGCTHFVPVSFCAREQTSNNTIYYIKESAMNSENSSRFFSYAGSGGRTTKND